ncbi:MAG: phosphoserine phosphatase SerB, partial [Myxococcales bacterium]|nr:phosphoserine phosphatase SerB [Myxococcales bacterium]
MVDPADAQRVLVTVTGPDTPGITAALTAVIADNHAELLDIEQVVVQGQLTLCLLIGLDTGRTQGDPVLKDLLFDAKRMGLDLQFKVLDETRLSSAPSPKAQRYAVTAIGDGLRTTGVQRIAAVLARQEANIEHIRRLSSGKLLSLEIILSLPAGADQARELRRGLAEATHDIDVDIAVQRERLTRRSKRLVVMDMDSTLIQIEVIDELARMHGVVDQVSEITRRAMAGELDFEGSLRSRVKLLEGMEYEKVLSLAKNLPVTDGAREMLHVLHTLGYKTGVISGGFTFAANALRDELGLDYAYANELQVRDGKLTGEVLDPVVTPQRKADLLDAIAQRENIALEQTIAIGDGANDMTMLQRAGLGIAFHAKPKLKEAADTSVSAGGLDRILYLLGLHARDVREL